MNDDNGGIVTTIVFCMVVVLILAAGVRWGEYRETTRLQEEFFAKHTKKLGFPVHPTGTYVCIQGPRFSTRAESRLFRQWGCDIIGMTLHPEAILAREAELCYVSIAMVTDYDVWAEKPVTSDEVMETMRSNSARFRELIMSALPLIPEKRTCSCGESLRYALL